jgi:hypothetical protein
LKNNNIGRGDIGRLSFVDHGKGLIPYLSDWTQEMGTVELTVDVMKQFTPYLAPNAIIVLYGCYVGGSTDYLKALSGAAGGRTVSAPGGAYMYNSAQKYTYSGKYLGTIYEPLQYPSQKNGFDSWPR